MTNLMFARDLDMSVEPELVQPAQHWLDAFFNCTEKNKVIPSSF